MAKKAQDKASATTRPEHARAPPQPHSMRRTQGLVSAEPDNSLMLAARAAAATVSPDMQGLVAAVTEARGFLAPGESLLAAMLLVSINRVGAEQERVVAVTDRALLRVKTDRATGRTVRAHRTPLHRIVTVQYGALRGARGGDRALTHAVRVHTDAGGAEGRVVVDAGGEEPGL